MNIILAGMPGCGKSTVARILGKKLNFRVVDTDELIVEKYGVISEIFEKFGEECFRNFETQVVKDIASADNCVVSTGGGCLLREQNRSLFKSCGKIIFLRTKLDTLSKRLEGDATRPLLKGDMQGRLQKLMQERAPIYENSADIVVDTDLLTPEEVADKITELIL
ncbi:MAG: shikimate kinase [Clostridiales bacterium]|nr:shikimate kinase [Clostridiales bacterium]